MKPILAATNVFDQDAESLAAFARLHGFEGIDWSFALDETVDGFAEKAKHLEPFEIRYHCRFPRVDLAYKDDRSEAAMEALQRSVRVAAAHGGRYVTVHIGLGLRTDDELDWGKGLDNLKALVEYGVELGIVVCLENLPALWTSEPPVFESMIALTGAGATIDVGHTEFRREQDAGITCDLYVTPHAERLFNAHIYHREISGMGHLAPANIDELSDRLDVLLTAPSCDWWVIELAGAEETVATKKMLAEYLDTLFESDPYVKLQGVRV
ncbi:MAG: sugar phosphate isomerase/epimerase family protein [Candidatus Aquicultorales bacterium]